MGLACRFPKQQDRTQGKSLLGSSQEREREGWQWHQKQRETLRLGKLQGLGKQWTLELKGLPGKDSMGLGLGLGKPQLPPQQQLK
jgi:hypothetical protein